MRTSARTALGSSSLIIIIALTGCSADHPDAAAQALLAEPSPCDGLVLDARLDYHPTRATDGHVAFAGGSLTFAIPASIEVTSGGAGSGKLTFRYRSGAGDATTCDYRGTGGPAYAFAKCALSDCDTGEDVTSDPALRPGTMVSADTFDLHVITGDKAFPATVVELVLPGPVVDDRDACTADACDAVTGEVDHTAIAVDDGDDCTVDSCDATTGPQHAPLDTAVCRGKANFHDRTLTGLGGNGRACSDCHMDAEGFQLTPAAARARYEQMIATGVDDPLFRAIDANDFRINGAAARDFTNLIENGLIRVTIPLPPNVKLLDCGSSIPCPASALPTSETVADVWRSVPPIFDVSITGPDNVAPIWPRGPNTTGGYQLDGRVDTLQHQALGALHGHAEIAFEPPTTWLDDVAAFQRTQFSSPSVRELADAMAAGTTPLPDPDPALDELETQGKAVFDRACGQCHGNLAGHPSGSTPILQGTQGTPTALIRYHPINSGCPRPVDTVSPPRFVFTPCSPSQLANVRTYEITNSGVAPTGTPCGATGQPPCVTRITTSDPGRLLLTGFPQPGGPGDIEHFDIPSLRGISRTAPYFTNNTAPTLEAVLDHYKAFFKRVSIAAPTAPFLTTQPGVVPPVHDRPFTDDEVPALLAYLRKI